MELTEAVRIVREEGFGGAWNQLARDTVLVALEQAQAQANVALLDAVRVRGELREMEAERDAAGRTGPAQARDATSACRCCRAECCAQGRAGRAASGYG